MRRKTDYWVTVIGTLIIVLVLGMIIGFCCARAHAAAVTAEEDMTFGIDALREGGAMRCVASEKPTPAAETVSDDKVIAEAPKTPRIAVNGQRLGKDLEDYLYGQLRERGLQWMYSICLCQIYQESRFNCMAMNPNGLDMGLCQFRITYWDKFARESGLVTYDIWNPIDQLYVYCYLMDKYITATGDIYSALSMYYTGSTTYNAKYVNDVLQWQYLLREE